MTRIRKLASTLAWTFATVPGVSLADPYDPVEKIGVDRITHFSVSSVMTATVLRGLKDDGVLSEREAFWGAFSVFSLGLGKELYDQHRGGRFDGGDLAADLLGASWGVVIQFEPGAARRRL